MHFSQQTQSVLKSALGKLLVNFVWVKICNLMEMTRTVSVEDCKYKKL